MCTVTYIPVGPEGGCLLTSSRDERKMRPAAAAPRWYEGATGRVLYPKDGQAGGSWFAVHEKGHALVLLNGAWEKHVPAPPYKRSRGLVFLDLAGSDDPAAAFTDLKLEGIEPFTVIIIREGRLYEARWDGGRRALAEASADRPAIWSSVTLYDPAIAARRREWFGEWLEGHPAPDMGGILQFHLTAGERDERGALLMKDEEGMCTVSITSVYHCRGGGFRDVHSDDVHSDDIHSDGAHCHGAHNHGVGFLKYMDVITTQITEIPIPGNVGVVQAG